MIVDHIENIARYQNCGKNIGIALKYLAENTGNKTLEDGKYVLVPDEVIAYVVTKETKNVEEAEMEIHKKFMDIHFILEGAERCGVAPLQDSVDYSEETDNGFYSCKNEFDVKIKENEFYAVWPMEPHRPLCNPDGEKIQIKKIICKVKVD